jgi:hypothetical protein
MLNISIISQDFFTQNQWLGMLSLHLVFERQENYSFLEQCLSQFTWRIHFQELWKQCFVCSHIIRDYNKLNEFRRSVWRNWNNTKSHNLWSLTVHGWCELIGSPISNLSHISSLSMRIVDGWLDIRRSRNLTITQNNSVWQRNSSILNLVQTVLQTATSSGWNAISKRTEICITQICYHHEIWPHKHFSNHQCIKWSKHSTTIAQILTHIYNLPMNMNRVFSSLWIRQ